MLPSCLGTFFPGCKRTELLLGPLDCCQPSDLKSHRDRCAQGQCPSRSSHICGRCGSAALPWPGQATVGWPCGQMDQNRSLLHWHLGLQAWEHSLCCSRAGAAGHQGTEATGAPEMVNLPDEPITSEGGTPAALGMLQGNTTCLFRTETGFARQVGP